MHMACKNPYISLTHCHVSETVLKQIPDLILINCSKDPEILIWSGLDTDKCV